MTSWIAYENDISPVRVTDNTKHLYKQDDNPGAFIRKSRENSMQGKLKNRMKSW